MHNFAQVFTFIIRSLNDFYKKKFNVLIVLTDN